MEEVVGRRYGRLFENGQEFPDLIVIDGGVGQVSSAMKAFNILEISAPALIGLAKREETIVFPDEREEIILDPRDQGLRLLQQVRDEAHRFANQFNADLRSKRIKESILDDFKGLGKVRRDALLNHFGSLDKLRKATPDQLRELNGIGPKLAENLCRFLQVKK
jgi:excinuclease ABC subunit C